MYVEPSVLRLVLQRLPLHRMIRKTPKRPNELFHAPPSSVRSSLSLRPFPLRSDTVQIDVGNSNENDGRNGKIVASCRDKRSFLLAQRNGELAAKNIRAINLYFFFPFSFLFPSSQMIREI